MVQECKAHLNLPSCCFGVHAGLLWQGGTGCKRATHGQVYRLSACMIRTADESDLCPSRLTWKAACLQTQIILMNADMYNEGTIALFEAGHIDTLESPYAASTALLEVGHQLLSLLFLGPTWSSWLAKPLLQQML